MKKEKKKGRREIENEGAFSFYSKISIDVPFFHRTDSFGCNKPSLWLLLVTRRVTRIREWHLCLWCKHKEQRESQHKQIPLNENSNAKTPFIVFNQSKVYSVFLS